MQNNPMMKMFIQNTISRNPQAKQLYESLKGKNEAELKKLIQELKQIKPRYIGTHLKLNKTLTELSILNWVLDEFEAI